MQVVAEILPDTQAVGIDVFQLPLGANAREEHHQLEFEEDDRVDGRAAKGRVALANQVTDKAHVQGASEVPVEMVGGNEILQ